jgi:hypothetical protein
LLANHCIATVRSNSTLAELKRSASSLSTILLAFLDTRVAGQETELPKNWPEIGVGDDEGFGNSVSERTGLTGYASAKSFANNIVFAKGVGHGKRLLNQRFEDCSTKVGRSCPRINRYISRAWRDPNFGGSIFAVASAVIA